MIIITWNDNPLKEPIIRGWIDYYARNSIEYKILILEQNIFKPAPLKNMLFFIWQLVFSKYDYVISHDIYSAFISLIITKIRRKKILYNVQELYSEFNPWSFRYKIKRKLLEFKEFFLYKYVDTLVFPNKHRKDYVVNQYRLFDKHIVILENLPTYLDTARYTKPFPEGKFLVYSGTITENRPISILGPLSVFLKKRGVSILIVSKPNKFLTSLLENYTNIFHIDYLPPDQLIDFLSKCYLGIAIYSKADKNNLFCAPVKFYDYILADLPFLIVDNPTMLEMSTYGQIFEAFRLESYESLEEKTTKLLDDYQMYKNNIKCISNESVTFKKYDDFLSIIHRKLMGSISSVS